MRLKPVNQQIVVVMGASSGIGRATALAFASKGACVVASARNGKGLDTLVHEIRRKGGVAVAVVADVANADQVKHVAARAITEFGRIDTWVHVAAVSVWAPFQETHPSEWKRLIEVNLLGQVHGAQAALPHLRVEGGALIHVSSVEAKISLPFSSAYAASKHGVAGFVDALRVELRREGAPVSVTQIMPAGINTPLTQNGLTRLGVEPRPPAPVYEPDLVARAIVYAAEHPVRDLVVGGAGIMALLAQRLSPRFVDELLLRRMGFEARLTRKPRSPSAPNNLFEPTLDANLKVRGDLGAEARPRSLGTRLQETAAARLGARVTCAGFAAAASVVDAIYALRFRRSLGGSKDEKAGAGAGLPAPVEAESRREAETREGKKPEETGKRKGKTEA
jgi:NAD(P)-dependent dehydrogenase (short-subunit alcohol dehydrogenase family)